MSNVKQTAPAKAHDPRYDPIQERAPDRDVTKADKKPEPDNSLTQRQKIDQEMEVNNLWIAEHRDDAQGVHQREMANAELRHRLIDLEVAGRDAVRQAETLAG